MISVTINFLTISFPAINPIAIELGPLAIRWYGLAYMTGLLLGWWYIRRLLNNGKLWSGPPATSANTIDDFLFWSILGVVLGGRIGYILFYQPQFYYHHPKHIFYLWEGGMAFHGALIAMGLITYFFAKSRQISTLSLLDLLGAATPIGLFFGRIANFINGELFGRVTNVPWAMVFPESDGQPRHPSQLYEAALEGLVLFILIRICTHHWLKLKTPGFIIGLFLAGYGLARILVELFRQPDMLHPISVSTPFTPGMVYSLPMVLLGLYFIYRAARLSP